MHIGKTNSAPLTDEQSAQLRSLLLQVGEVLGWSIEGSATAHPELIGQMAAFHGDGARIRMTIEANPAMVRGEMARVVEAGRVEILTLFEHTPHIELPDVHDGSSTSH